MAICSPLLQKDVMVIEYPFHFKFSIVLWNVAYSSVFKDFKVTKYKAYFLAGSFLWIMMALHIFLSCMAVLMLSLVVFSPVSCLRMLMSWALPHQVKTQFLHFRSHAEYFLLPWKFPEVISRRLILFHN